MNDQYVYPNSPRCQEINRQVKLAERHQQAYYRDELIQPAKKELSVWSGVWKLARTLAALGLGWKISLSSIALGQQTQHGR